jgi:hypothetical protein
MKSYIVYNSEGEILRTGICASTDLEKQAHENEYVMEGVANDVEHIIVDNTVTDKPSPPPPTDAELNDEVLDTIRQNRHQKLISSDWTQVNDSPLTDAKKLEWANYRQQLRDLPSQHQTTTNIEDLVYPSMPE